MRPLTICVVLGALALPAVAGAAPVAVSPRTVEANPVSLAFDATGDGLASWRGLSGTADTSRTYHALAARTPAGEWQPPVTLPRTVLMHDVALFGADRVALVTEREQPAGKARTRSLISLQLGTAVPLMLGPPRVLYRGPRRHVGYDGPHPTAFSPLVGVSDTGTMVVAWGRASGIWALVGNHVRRLGPFGHSPSLHLAPDGFGLLTWRRGSLILARVRSASGRWGRIERVARIGRYSEAPPVSSAGADGRFAVGLTEITRSMSGVHWVSTLHTRQGGWHAKRLESRTFVPTGATTYVTDNLQTLVTMTTDGQFHVAWPGRFGNDVALDAIAPGPSGAWAATWFNGSPNLTEQGSQTTSGFATERSLAGSRVAYDPLTGKPVVIWSQGEANAGFQIVAGAGGD
jgi:hypothetical protein